MIRLPSNDEGAKIVYNIDRVNLIAVKDEMST